MRADRLVAALMLLQVRRRITAAELASELEVSLATARRDLEALALAGVPIYPQPGRGGGWSLVGGARTDLSGLTAAEAQALFLQLGREATGVADPALRSALRKLVGALPSTFRAPAGAAAEATVHDRSGWDQRRRARPEAALAVLQDAVVRRRKVAFSYTGRNRQATERLVDPWGLVDKDDVWYLVAGTDAGTRTFRVERMAGIAVTESAAERPTDLDLVELWREVVDEVERARSAVDATVLVAPHRVPVLHNQFGRHCEELGPGDAGRVRVRLGGPSALSLAEHLAGWGATLEVTEPQAVREQLARLGAELVQRYASPA